MIVIRAEDELMEVCSHARFATSDEEIVTVPSFVILCLKAHDILPSLIVHRGRAFEARALVALSLFSRAMERRYDRGGPHPRYYRNVAVNYLHQDGKHDLADHFDNWTAYLGEHLA